MNPIILFPNTFPPLRLPSLSLEPKNLSFNVSLLLTIPAVEPNKAPIIGPPTIPKSVVAKPPIIPPANPSGA